MSTHTFVFHVLSDKNTCHQWQHLQSHRIMQTFNKQKSSEVNALNILLFDIHKTPPSEVKHKGSRAWIHHSAAPHLGTVSVSLVYPLRSRMRTAVGTVMRTNPLAILSFSLKLIGTHFNNFWLVRPLKQYMGDFLKLLQGMARGYCCARGH